MKNLLKCFVTYWLVSEIFCLDFGDLIEIDPDTFKNVSELITSRGYPVEEYTVQTDDGYLLSLQRIPYGKNERDSMGKKPAVLLVHGIIGDANVWVWDFPHQSLGFILADNGYDVWLGNVRGNTYSRRHVTLSPDQEEFWDFSIDEKALHDLPAMIDFILSKAELNTLSYVGWSQGTTLAFALLSKKPYYNEKINLFAAYAPVVVATHTTGLLGLLANIGVHLQPIYKKIGLYEILPHSSLITLFSVLVCATPLRTVCENIYYNLFGLDALQLNSTRLPIYFNQYPAGESTKLLIHFSQLKFSNRFQMYDYKERNLEFYNQSTPPEYDVSKITTPVALFSGLSDVDSDPLDVDTLRKMLKSTVKDYVVPILDANHGDFVVAMDGYSLIHKELLTQLAKYAKT